MQTKNAIKKYMREQVEEDVDYVTGEVNYTNLALWACTHFDDFEGDEVPEEYYDLAVEVGVWYEKKTGYVGF